MKAPGVTLLNAIEALINERMRQVTKGYVPEHDDDHAFGELPAAAACYASRASGNPLRMFVAAYPFEGGLPPRRNNENARSDALKAAALLLAEVERIDRRADNGDADDVTDAGGIA